MLIFPLGNVQKGALCHPPPQSQLATCNDSIRTSIHDQRTKKTSRPGVVLAQLLTTHGALAHALLAATPNKQIRVHRHKTEHKDGVALKSIITAAMYRCSNAPRRCTKDKACCDAQPLSRERMLCTRARKCTPNTQRCDGR
jgi:hypothetical protein